MKDFAIRNGEIAKPTADAAAAPACPENVLVSGQSPLLQVANASVEPDD